MQRPPAPAAIPLPARARPPAACRHHHGRQRSVGTAAPSPARRRPPRRRPRNPAGDGGVPPGGRAHPHAVRLQHRELAATARRGHRADAAVRRDHRSRGRRAPRERRADSRPRRPCTAQRTRCSTRWRRPRRSPPATRRRSSTSPSTTAGAERSSMPIRELAASGRRPHASSTSPRWAMRCTPAGFQTPTSSCAPPASSASATSCSGKRPTRSCTSPTRSGPTSARTPSTTRSPTSRARERKFGGIPEPIERVPAHALPAE